MDVRELVGKEVVKRYFLTHVIPEKFRSDLDDGIYDFDKNGHKWRVVIINGCTIYTISKMWLDKGGPVDLPEEFRYRWGTYLK